MRKLLVTLAIAAFVAAPAAAERTVIPLDPSMVELTPLSGVGGGLRAGDVYDAYTPITQTFVTAITAGSGETGDDVHMTAATYTHMHWLHSAVNTVTTFGTHGVIVWFYSNSAANMGMAASSSLVTFPFLAGFSVTGIPNNFAGTISVGIGSGIVGNVGPDMWVSFEKFGFPGAQFDGIIGGAAPVIGGSAPTIMFTGYSPAHGVTPHVTSNLGLGFGVPEPATICLMAAGALAILRRRRA